MKKILPFLFVLLIAIISVFGINYISNGQSSTIGEDIITRNLTATGDLTVDGNVNLPNLEIKQKGFRVKEETRVEAGYNHKHSVANTEELTVMVKFKLNKLNNDITEGDNHYVNFCGKTKYEADAVDNGKEYYFRYYNLDSPERPQRMSFYHFNNEPGLGTGSQVEEPVAIGEWITLIGRVNTADNRISLSKNGVLRDTDALSNYSIIPVITPAPFTWGRIKSSIGVDSTIDMTFAETAIWDRELTDDEVAEIENGVIPSGGLIDYFDNLQQ